MVYEPMTSLASTSEERILEYAQKYSAAGEEILAQVFVGMDEMARWYAGQEFRRLGLEALTTLRNARPLTEAEIFSCARRARMTIEAEQEMVVRAFATRPTLWERIQTAWHNVCGT